MGVFMVATGTFHGCHVKAAEPAVLMLKFTGPFFGITRLQRDATVASVGRVAAKQHICQSRWRYFWPLVFRVGGTQRRLRDLLPSFVCRTDRVRFFFSVPHIPCAWH